MHSLIKKVGSLGLASAVLFSGATIVDPLDNEVFAASEYKYFTTVKTSTAGSDFAVASVAVAAAGAFGYGLAGAEGAAISSVGSYHLGNALSNLKTVYMTDKQYINNANQIKHNVTFYSDKARTKKLGTAKWITSMLYPGGDKTLAPKEN